MKLYVKPTLSIIALRSEETFAFGSNPYTPGTPGTIDPWDPGGSGNDDPGTWSD